jgi:hypothetical protein
LRTITIEFSERRCQCGALLEYGCGAAANAGLAPAGAAASPVTHGASADAARTQRREGGETAVTVSIPLVVILGAAALVAWRYMGLRVWQAVLCLLFGFFVAATTAAPEIRQLVTAIVQWLTNAKP